MTDWHDFFLGEVGASAALTGLLFVAISINLSKVLDQPGLPGRAAEALLLLGAVVIVSSMALLPQPPVAFGVEAALAGLVLWVTVVSIQLRASRSAAARFTTRNFVSRVVLAQASALPVLAGAVLVATGTGAGLYAVAAGLVIAVVVAIATAWVLLVEINR